MTGKTTSNRRKPRPTVTLLQITQGLTRDQTLGPAVGGRRLKA